MTAPTTAVELANSVSFADPKSAVLVVAGAAIGLILTIKAVQIVFRAVRGS